MVRTLPRRSVEFATSLRYPSSRSLYASWALPSPHPLPHRNCIRFPAIYTVQTFSRSVVRTSLRRTWFRASHPIPILPLPFPLPNTKTQGSCITWLKHHLNLSLFLTKPHLQSREDFIIIFNIIISKLPSIAMATFDLLDPSSLDPDSFAATNPDPFSKAFDDDFAFPMAGENNAETQYQPSAKNVSKPGFQVDPLNMDARLLGHPLTQTHPHTIDPLRFRLPLSPPGSDTISPKQWPHDERDPFQSSRFASSDPTAPAFSLFGQMTPPEDETLIDSESRGEHDGLHKSNIVHSSPTIDASRDRSSSDNQTKSKTKRNRKSTGRGAKRHSANGHDPNDLRRSKFLERNRVAASKCRQKKKEWTSNLEEKARELQAENNNLHLWLDSLRDEYMYLKTQIAEHRTCGNRAINNYLDDPKRDLLALSNPASRSLLESMRRHRIKQEPEEEEQAEEVDHVSEEEDALGALLADSIGQTSAS